MKYSDWSPWVVVYPNSITDKALSESQRKVVSSRKITIKINSLDMRKNVDTNIQAKTMKAQWK